MSENVSILLGRLNVHVHQDLSLIQAEGFVKTWMSVWKEELVIQEKSVSIQWETKGVTGSIVQLDTM